MICVRTWMLRVVDLLRDHFGPRLLFVGLQGSYRREEAGEDSDIDILTVVDRLGLGDLRDYRALLDSLPEGCKAGGFTCGREELQAWPAHEIFQFAQDTDAYYGQLEPLLPAVTRNDVLIGARAGVSALHHAATYAYLAGSVETRADALQGLCKGAFFSLQLVHYLRCGLYAHRKKDLLAALDGSEAELLRLGMDRAALALLDADQTDNAYTLLLNWTGKTLRELADRAGKDNV